VGGRLVEGGEEGLFGLLEPFLLEERDPLTERRRLYGRLSQKPREKEDQDPSSAKTALATAWPLVPAAQPA